MNWVMRSVFPALLSAVTLAACASRGGSRPGDKNNPASPIPSGPVATNNRRIPNQPDVVQLYRRLGLLAEGGETPFVGSLAFLGARSPDSTIVVVSVSLPNRSLRFAREGDRYRAAYNVGLE